MSSWWKIGRRRGLGLPCGALYGLPNPESNALVTGSLLLFVVLAALMVATRKVDWYQVGKGAGAAQAALADGAPAPGQARAPRLRLPSAPMSSRPAPIMA
ncbi:inner membrane CreD family protein [Janthinobacterium fluminis]|uniref:inner membrane CreD family protein n=1 Tax=Janthinobacterium fluminis TaxID=2987524 RepID=UPI003B432734